MSAWADALACCKNQVCSFHKYRLFLRLLPLHSFKFLYNTPCISHVWPCEMDLQWNNPFSQKTVSLLWLTDSSMVYLDEMILYQVKTAFNTNMLFFKLFHFHYGKFCQVVTTCTNFSCCSENHNGRKKWNNWMMFLKFALTNTICWSMPWYCESSVLYFEHTSCMTNH